MKRIFAIALTFVLMITAFTFTASAAEKPFLPDPGVYLDAQGQVYDSGSDNGESYVIYQYVTYHTLDEMNAFINTYVNDLAQLNYTAVNLDSDNAAYYAQYQHSTGPVAELMILFNDDYDRVNAGESCEWIVLVYVPGTIDFTLGVASRQTSGNGGNDGNSGNTGNDGGHDYDGLPCIPCGATGDCWICGGTGEATFGPVTGPCIGCMGTGNCGICQGHGGF